MHILIYGINYSPELTGIGKYTAEMAEWLVQNGNEVSVITAMPYYPEWEVHEKYREKWWYKEVINGVAVLRCPLYVPKEVSSKKRIIHEFSFLCSSSFRWFAALFRRKYDLIITLAPPFHINIFPYLYSRLKKTLIVNHIQDLQVDAAKDLNMLTNMHALNMMFAAEKFLLKNSAYVSTLTLGMKKRILQKGISESKILMLPNWVDLSFIRPLTSKESLRGYFSIPEDDTVMLYSGNMGKKQGLDMLLLVAEMYKQRADVHFLMVGDGGEKDNLMRQARDRKLGNVLFHPLLTYEKLPALLATADIHFVLQKKEASDLVMPSKLTGILAAGGCAVVTAMPGTSLYEEIEEHDMGILCEPESASALKEAIEKALSEDHSMMKANARRYAERFLDKNEILTDFIEKTQGK